MMFQRRFYRSSLNRNDITLKRLLLAIIFGFVSAIVIYSFFYVVRETFRVMQMGDILPNIVSETERLYYNYFFAGLSFVFGNSIAINLLFSRPQRVLHRLDTKRHRILNEQIFVNFNFSYWLTKIGLAIGIMTMCCTDFDFRPYLLTAILLLLVLFLESWKTLSLVLKKNRYKYQLLNLLTLVLLSFGLAQVDIIDYKSLDENALRSNPIVNQPHVDFYNEDRFMYGRAIYFKIDVDDKNEPVIYDEYGKKIPLNYIPLKIIEERMYLREELQDKFIVWLIANKDIDLIHIKKIEAELLMVNQWKIVYDVYNDDLLSRRFERRGLKKYISLYVERFLVDGEIIPLPYFVEESKAYKDTLRISIGDDIKVNGLPISKDILIRKFKNSVNTNTAFEYQYNTDTKYQTYITVFSAHSQAVDELRKKEQTIFPENPQFLEYSEYKKFSDEQWKLKKKYPLTIIEKFSETPDPENQPHSVD